MSQTNTPITGISRRYTTVAKHALRWSLPFLAALLPIMLLSMFSYRVASESVQHLVESQNLSATNNIAQLLQQDFRRMYDISNAIASIEGTVDAVRRKDDLALRTRLNTIILTYPQIDRAFVTDTQGKVWADSAQVLGDFGRSQQMTDWYRGLSLRWKPYISNAYVRSHDPDHPVVAIARPVFDETQRVIGTMVLEYRTSQIRRWLQDIHVGEGGYIYVVDKTSTVIAHPLLPDNVLHRSYKEVMPITRALSGSVFSSMEYMDPVAGEKMIASFQPISVGGNNWVIVAQQPVSKAYAPLESVRLRISLVGGVLTLVTISMVVALALMTYRNERLNSQLAAKNQTLQDITSFVSHQLRAPVAAMRWTIEGMMEGDYGKINEKLHEPLESLKNVALQNGKLIDDILNVSRIDRGVIEVQAEKTDLKEIAERAMRDYHVAAEKAGLTLELKDAQKKISVMADKEKMAESVTNAISNAIKHTKNGGITLSLRADEKFGYIDVTDTGEGMPAEIMNNLFSRTGVKGKNTDSGKSTGLGLYIARNFMHLQGGDIIVASEQGKGSTFTYSIPLAIE
jgi:signal transduction histidine kinase